MRVKAYSEDDVNLEKTIDTKNMVARKTAIKYLKFLRRKKMTKRKKLTICLIVFMLAASFVFGTVLFLTLKTKTPTIGIDATEDGGTVTDENGNRLSDDEYYDFPARLLFAPAALATTPSAKIFKVNLVVTIKPDTAANKPLDWTVDFVDPEDEWALGKKVTDYVTVTPTADGAKTAMVTCLQAFGSQIKVTVSARENPNIFATSILDYKQQLISYDLSVAQNGKTPTINNVNKTGKLFADIETDNEIIFDYSYSKSDIYTVSLDDDEIIKPAAMTVSYKTLFTDSVNKIKDNLASQPVATANENGFKVTGFLSKDMVKGLSAEDHNKLISVITSNASAIATVALQDESGNELTKYVFDADVSLVKLQGEIESLVIDKPNFEFGNVTKTYSITYLQGKSKSMLGLFEIGSEHGNGRRADGSYPTSYKYGEKITISNLKDNYVCGGEYHSGSGSSASYSFKGWYLDWDLTQPFTGEFSADMVGDIVLYADIVCTGSHFY